MAATRRIVFALVLLAAFGARADDRAGAGLWVHTDDDGLTVIHPVATARVEVTEGTHVSAGYEADVISAATIDVRTSASPRGFDETRHGVSLGADHELARTARVGASTGLSYAPDHQTYSGALRGSLEDDARTNTVSASLGVAREVVGRAGDLEPMGGVWTVGGALAWTTLLSSEAVLDLSAAVERQHGYLESPYRFVPIVDAMGQLDVRVPERVPDGRWRGSGRARLRMGLARGVFAVGWYRLHLDDWGVAGHTVELSAAFEPAEGWLVTAHGRFYGQRGATFYQGTYATLPEMPVYRTLDRELAPGFYVAGGARVEYEAGEWLGMSWRFDGRAEVLRQRYFDTPSLPEKLALTAGIGLVVQR